MSVSTADATDFGQIELFRRELTGDCLTKGDGINRQTPQ
jgi:hypothetical protein